MTRQFRYPAYVNGCDDFLIEVPAGLLDEHAPEEAIRKETREEAGNVVHGVKKIFEAYTSPGQ